ncbi:dephospho-CoA kinase [Candidatus Methylobacter favarea]|uniref:Dephospho-CoA kinase n=1 Tax=Candidatus Methylobacter favarea TaxID=2707345 RepID=A0A8S0XEL6_9GAMM|nr:dephospho-CoA kinase [Candidatus Methylobacter favarea]CAA9889872.1 dephospho-CoA kinase [Candidatus Methylobacter favarea]
MLKIGLTGGIGCGKTTVARLFANLGTPVIDADEVAHQLVAVGQPALVVITQEFGESILNPDGSLNRNNLREQVFSNPEKKQKLEAILHPLVYKTIQSEIEKLNAPYCIICIPLLLETGMSRFVDRILVVDCPVEAQIARVKSRDNLSLQRIQSIIDSQVSRAFRKSKADDIIDNSETDYRLAEQVKKLHNLYHSLSL